MKHKFKIGDPAWAMQQQLWGKYRPSSPIITRVTVMSRTPEKPQYLRVSGDDVYDVNPKYLYPTELAACEASLSLLAKSRDKLAAVLVKIDASLADMQNRAVKIRADDRPPPAPDYERR